jgi:hypothetical protein
MMPPPIPATKQVTVDGQAMDPSGKLDEGVRSTQLFAPSVVTKIRLGAGCPLNGFAARL